MKPGFTVNDLTPSAIGCLIESFQSSGKVPILNKLESIKEIRKKIINEGIYGTASKKDLQELREEGIEAQMIPWVEENNN